MHPPSARRRWACNFGNNLPYAGTAIATNRDLLLELVAGLLSIPGVAVHCSSDGAAAGAVGDGVNRWVDTGDLVWANAGTAHSWIVLQLPPGLRYDSPAAAYLIIDLNFTAAAGNLGTVLLAASVSGGSLTARPSGTKEVVISAPRNTANALFPASPTSGYTWHLQWAYVDPLTSGGVTSVSAIRLFLLDEATVKVAVVVLLEKPGDSITGAAREAVIGTWQADTLGDHAMSPLAATDSGLLRFHDGTTTVLVGLALRTFDSNILESGWGVVLDEDGRRLVYPIDLVSLGGGTVLGRLTDAYYTDGAAIYTLSPPGSTGRTWITFGPMMVPHPSGATPPMGSANEIDAAVFGEAPIGSMLAGVSPVGGSSLGASRDEARWTPITIDVVIGGAGAVPLVWGYFGADPGLRHVIYDGAAFAPFFEDSSTVTRVGDVYTFHLLPIGGWWDSPTIKAGAWTEAV